MKWALPRPSMLSIMTRWPPRPPFWQAGASGRLLFLLLSEIRRQKASICIFGFRGGLTLLPGLVAETCQTLGGNLGRVQKNYLLFPEHHHETKFACLSRTTPVRGDAQLTHYDASEPVRKDFVSSLIFPKQRFLLFLCTTSSLPRSRRKPTGEALRQMMRLAAE
jgi:hypothetical protein